MPRRFVGEGALVEEPVMIVGLVKELEYREGAVLPHVRRVIEMPRAVNSSAPSRAIGPPRIAPVVGIRIEAEPRSRAWRILLAAVAAAVPAAQQRRTQPAHVDHVVLGQDTPAEARQRSS